MKKLLSVFLLFLCATSEAQTITPQGSPTQTYWVKGVTINDSLFIVPLRDTVFPSWYPVSLRKTGCLILQSSTSKLCVYTGTRWEYVSPQINASFGSRVKLPYSNPINTVAQIKLSDSGDITLTPDFVSPTIGATTRLVIVGDGSHVVYAPNYYVEEGNKFTGVANMKYEFFSWYDGVRYYGRFSPIYDTFNCIGFKSPNIAGKKVVIFGNSVSLAVGATTSYGSKFATLTGSTLVQNSQSGMAMQQVAGYTFPYLNTFNIPKWDSTIGYIIIALGENDVNQVNAGTYAFSLPGYRAKYNRVMANLASKGYPTDRIILFTPFYFLNAPVATQETYASVVREIAKSSGVVLFDAFLKMRDFPGIDTSFNVDGLHPKQPIQDSLASWLYTMDFRTELQKGCRKNWALATNGSSAAVTNTFTIYDKKFAINGIRRTNTITDTTNTGSAWLSDTTGLPVTYEVTFNSAKKISEANVFSIPDGSLNWYTNPTLSTTSTQNSLISFTLDYWTGSIWSTLYSVTGNNKAWRNFTFPQVTTTKMRVNITAIGPASKSAPLVEFETLGDDSNSAIGPASKSAPLVEFETLGDDSSTLGRIPIINYAYALESALQDSMNSQREASNFFLSKKYTIGGDSVAFGDAFIGTLSNNNFFAKTNGIFRGGFTSGGAFVLGKNATFGPRFDMTGAGRSDSAWYANWLALFRFDVNTGVANFNPPVFPNYSPFKSVRTGAGSGDQYLSVETTKYYKTFDDIEGWEYIQTSSIDTVRYHDGTTNMGNQRSFKLYVTRVTSPNLPMLQASVKWSSGGVPQITIIKGSGTISLSVSSSNKVVISTGTGQLQVGVKPFVDRSGIYPPFEESFSSTDSINTAVLVKNMAYTSATPSITMKAAAGTLPNFSIVGCNQGVRVTMTIGTSPAASDTVFRINYSSPFLAPNGTIAGRNPINDNANGLSGSQNVKIIGTQYGCYMMGGLVPLTAGQQYIFDIPFIQY